MFKNGGLLKMIIRIFYFIIITHLGGSCSQREKRIAMEKKTVHIVTKSGISFYIGQSLESFEQSLKGRAFLSETNNEYIHCITLVNYSKHLPASPIELFTDYIIINKTNIIIGVVYQNDNHDLIREGDTKLVTNETKPIFKYTKGN